MAFDLQKDLSQKFKSWTDVLNRRIESKWSELDEGIYTEHMAIANPVVLTSQGFTTSVEFTGLGAFILEFGSGSLMVTSTGDFLSGGNEVFDSYRNSSDWNIHRKGTAITGREKGSVYKTPSGGTMMSTGGMKGRNLEEPHGRIKALNPKSPLHIIQQEVLMWSEEVENDLESYVALKIESYLDNTFYGRQ